MLGLVLALLLTKPTDLTTPPKELTRVLRPGTGAAHPTDHDLVKVFYVLWNRDGVVVDQMNGAKWVVVGSEEMSPAWRRDIQRMVVGEQRRTWVDDNSILDTELVEIIPRPETPPDVAAPPADATVTPSGLAYKLITKGPGKTHPKPGDRVLVSYTGWTTDGKIFDGCALRGEPNIELPVSGGIAGWTEGIQLMTDGTKMRFWMPPKLAYAGVPDKPQGMVVFDVQLFIVSSEIMQKRGQRKKIGAPVPAPPLPPEQLPNDVSTQLLQAGKGTVHPDASQYVRLHYTLWSLEGKKMGEVLDPQVGIVAVKKLSSGWRSVVERMVEGEQRRAWIPDDKLIIDTELVGIVQPPATPADLAAPPDDAIKTKSGLAYRVLRPGTGDKHPSRRSTVRVHYSGWTKDGNMFDSSVIREQPAEFPLDGVIAGWTEGLQLMTPGEVVRFWIPAKLAYASDPSKPQGMLVFDIELLAIK